MLQLPRETYHGAFPRNTKVDTVIAAIVKAKALAAAKKYKLFNGDEQIPFRYSPLVQISVDVPGTQPHLWRT